MTKLTASLQFQKLPRIAAYALLAALVTTALFAADRALRRSHDASMQQAAPLTEERSVKIGDPAPAPTQHANTPPQDWPPLPEDNASGGLARAEDPPAGVAIERPAGVAVEKPAGDPVADLTAPAIPAPIPAPTSSAATDAVPDNAASRQAQPTPSRQIRRQQVRRPAAKQVTRERAKSSRPVQAQKPPARREGPDVYWERDSQLGFAPQLRSRICNPATGHMPMQCYYPREGRERFPAKSVD